MDKNEKKILKFLHENIDTQHHYYPKEILESVDIKIDELKAAKICSKLQSIELIDAITFKSSDPDKLGNTYRINSKGIDEVNPFSKNKIQHNLIILSTIFAGIAALGVIITLVIVAPKN